MAFKGQGRSFYAGKGMRQNNEDEWTKRVEISDAKFLTAKEWKTLHWKREVTTF